MNNRPGLRHQRGFNIVEVMVVVAILAVLAAIAAPNMGAMIRTQRIKTAAFDVFSSLTFARSEAIKRNTSVTLTPASAADWSKGWEIVDANGNLLRKQSGWDAIEATGPAQVRFLASGRLSAAVGNIALTAADVQEGAKRCVTIDFSGRAVTKEGAC